jgi:hypothetical protein
MFKIIAPYVVYSVYINDFPEEGGSLPKHVGDVINKFHARIAG